MNDSAGKFTQAEVDAFGSLPTSVQPPAWTECSVADQPVARIVQIARDALCDCGAPPGVDPPSGEPSPHAGWCGALNETDDAHALAREVIRLHEWLAFLIEKASTEHKGNARFVVHTLTLEALLTGDPDVRPSAQQRSFCGNCAGPLIADPLMPDGFTHWNGALLCPGHSTVSSDGSNSARPDQQRSGVEVIGCVVLNADGDVCNQPAEWRPASILMAPFEWFCRDHAVLIAQREGVYGVYNRNSRDRVEEIPDV